MMLQHIRMGRGGLEGGFTLVDLTALITILGVVAATALPRMSALGGEARYALLNSARGALSSVATLAHGKFLINGETSQAFDDSLVRLVYAYPAASQTTADAAGLRTGYVVYTGPRGGTATTPAVPPGAMVLVPKDVAGTAKALACFLVYEQASAAHPFPKLSFGANTNSRTCH